MSLIANGDVIDVRTGVTSLNRTPLLFPYKRSPGTEPQGGEKYQRTLERKAQDMLASHINDVLQLHPPAQQVALLKGKYSDKNSTAKYC